MKKRILAVLLSAIFVFTLLSGCSNNNDVEVHLNEDVWDGTIATAFEKGNGTESNPYVISKGSQLAFLAQEVNSGKDYANKFFSLACDLNLNGLEWTPIGNGTHSFSGTFDGNNHFITNLKINNEVQDAYSTGLFGRCTDATVKNMSLRDAEILLQNTVDRNEIAGGILIGSMHVESSATISNISIVEAKVVCDFSLDISVKNLYIGGVIGIVDGQNSSLFTMSSIHSETNISIEKGSGIYNDIGGIVGALITNSMCDIHNCASYLSVKTVVDESHVQNKYFGAFGAIHMSDNTISISKVFSKLSTNKLERWRGDFAYNAIIGEATCGKQEDGRFHFQNLFGFVEQINELTGEVTKSMQLYEFPNHVIFSETNCHGCEQLPTNHGFDETIWNLEDPFKPQLR